MDRGCLARNERKGQIQGWETGEDIGMEGKLGRYGYGKEVIYLGMRGRGKFRARKQESDPE